MNTIFCLMGPTACGKTDLACALVERFPLEIISVDSAMIYREMNIGTAKPSPVELAQYPHHLIDIINPDASYSAANFCKDVEDLCKVIYQRGKWPLLTGGTMMYFNALQKGLSYLPKADPAIRARLLEQVAQQGWDSLFKRLQDCDPKTASRLHANDTQRILRALEVYEITGSPLSSSIGKKSGLSARFINIGLFPKDRLWLHQRIAQRFLQMLDGGLIEETEHLVKKWSLTATHPSMKTVGYRQVLPYLAGQYDVSTLKNKGIAATRQLAKRQITWLRSWENIWYVDPQEEGYEQQVFRHISRILTDAS